MSLVVPKSLIKEILRDVHGSVLTNHFGFHKTFHLVLSRFYWLFMSSVTRKFVKTTSVQLWGNPRATVSLLKGRK